MIDNQTLQSILNYQNITEGYSYGELSQLKNFKTVLSNNKIYFGQVFNSKKHGKGVLWSKSGHIYEGEFNNNRKHGFGMELFQQKSSYCGSYLNGRPEGLGKFIWGNGESYDGEWLNGYKHGYGTWIGLKGDSYSGQWAYDKPHGQGIHKWINGEQYQGEFKECLKHGFGEEIFSNGDRYIGMYQNGTPEGEGEYFYSSGAYFHGQFLNGFKSGYGEYRCANYSYKGYYQNDKKNGEGELIYADGSRRKGKFYNDLFENNETTKLTINTQPENSPQNLYNITNSKTPFYLSQTKPIQKELNSSSINKTVNITRNIQESKFQKQLNLLPIMNNKLRSNSTRQSNQDSDKILYINQYKNNQSVNSKQNSRKTSVVTQPIAITQTIYRSKNQQDFSQKLESTIRKFHYKTELKGTKNQNHRSVSSSKQK
ncbi:unnamed protein product [Paramecium primaurelia]|uniref:MORN motif protein n=1 Tax=Paramecium primaurelia TaxID=5886 RepID=A0A8S1P8K3_PARPR|nr:unnamed protein product [Paramecium primaurelia]